MWRGLPLSVLLSRERAAFALVYRKKREASNGTAASV